MLTCLGNLPQMDMIFCFICREALNSSLKNVNLQNWSRPFSSDSGMVFTWMTFTVASDYGQAYHVSDVCPFLRFAAQLDLYEYQK